MGERIPDLAYVDDLTGLSNRRSLRRILPEQLKEAETANIPLSLLVLDVDYFKDVNDTRGHQTGDEALTEMAELLRASVRETDAVFRYAGDEFVIVLPDTDNSAAMKVAHSLTQRVSSRALEVFGKPVNLTISIGVATYPEDGDNLFALFDLADRAMYARKRRGRDGVCSRIEVAEDVDFLKPVFCPELVGRKDEQARLKELFRHSMNRKGSLVFVTGEAGIGKTRLLDEFAQTAKRQGADVLVGRCFGEPTSLPYQPFREAFGNYAHDSGEPKMQKMLKSIPEAYRNELVRLVPELSELGLESGGLVELKPDEARFRLFDAFRQLLGKVSVEKPVILVLDDLHLADESSSQLLQYLARNLRELPILVCGAFRGEELAAAKDTKKPISSAMQSMSREDLFSSIPLRRLSEYETSRMIGLILNAERIPKAFSERIYSETEGNPFFVEEVLKSLIQAGKVTAKSDLSKVDLEGLEIPVAIKDIVQRRWDMLDPEGKRVLTCASVMGERFAFGALYAMSGLNEGHLLDLLEQALKFQLLKEEEGEWYRFTHRKINETIYEGVLRAKRKKLHRLAGESLEKVLGERAEDFALDLSRQFYMGEKWREAFQYSYKAGQKAKEVYANEDAITSYKKALDAFGRLDSGERERLSDAAVSTHYEMGDVYWLTARYEDAVRSYEEGLSKASLRGDRIRAQEGLRKIGEVHIDRASYEEALKQFEESLAVSKEINDKAGLAACLNNIGKIHYHSGCHDEALRHYENSLEIARGIGDRHSIALNLNNIGNVHDSRGSYGEALKYYEEALAVAREIGDELTTVFCLNNIGIAHCNVGSGDKALRYWEDCLAIAREIGYKYGAAACMNNIGNVHGSKGSYDEALKCYGDSLAIAREIGDRSGMAYCLNNIGNVHGSKGSYDEALRYYKESLGIRKEIGDKSGIFECLIGIGSVHHGRGSYGEALECYKDCLTIAREMGDKYGIAACLNNIGNIHDSRGSYDEALKDYEESLAIKREIGDKSGVAFCLCNIGSIRDSRGYYDEAMRLHEESLGLREEIGDRSGVFECVLSMGKVLDNRGCYDDALRLYEECLKLSRELGDDQGIAGSMIETGLVHVKRGSHDEAVKCCDQAMAIGRKTDSAQMMAAAFALLAETHTALGNNTEAEDAISNLDRLAQSMESRVYRLRCLTFRARLLCPLPEALPYAEEALRLSEEMKTPESTWRVHQIIGRVLKEKGDLSEAEKHLKEAKDIIDSIASRISDPDIRNTYLNKAEHRQLSAEYEDLR